MLSRANTGKIRIKIVPFRYINAITDISTKEVFLSYKCFNEDKWGPVIADEMAHIISGEIDHTDKWQETYDSLTDEPIIVNRLLDENRRRLGLGNIQCVGNATGIQGVSMNIGNVTGIQGILTDYHLLQSYRRFSQRILSTEGHWECLGDRKIRLFPTPKGSFPVCVLYIPSITKFNNPIAKSICNNMLLAESMIILGNTRGKFSGIPSPDGGSMSLNGDALYQKGMELKEKMIEQANNLAEPMPILRF